MRLFFTILMTLSVVAGFLIAFVYFPHWLVHRYPLTPLRKTVAKFALAGLLIPIAFETKYELTGTEILSQSVYLWPASIGLMAINRDSTRTGTMLVLGITTLSNIGLYAFLGSIVGIGAGDVRTGRHL